MRVVQFSPFSAPPTPLKEEIFPSTSPVKPPFSRGVFDFKSFRTDDWLLLGLIVVLILDGSEDYVLLCALGYLFLIGFGN